MFCDLTVHDRLMPVAVKAMPTASMHNVSPDSLLSDIYRKVPKFSDARKLWCNLPKMQEKRPNLRVFVKKTQMEKQTVKTLISLILVCTVCPDLSVG